MLTSLSQWIAQSQVREWALWPLTNISGFPPLIQSVHLLSICVIFASAVFLSMRMLGIAARSQRVDEMSHRLRTCFFMSLSTAFVSGSFFILARPARYFDNPVFQIKFVTLLFAVAVSVLLFSLARINTINEKQWGLRVLALINVLSWILVILAGRWIAYSEYLFWREY